MLSIKIILNFVYFVFSLLLASESHSKYECRETGRESACNPNCTKSVQKELAVDYYFLWTGVFNTPSFSQKTPTLLIFFRAGGVSLSSVIFSDMILCSSSSYKLHYPILFYSIFWQVATSIKVQYHHLSTSSSINMISIT